MDMGDRRTRLGRAETGLRDLLRRDGKMRRHRRQRLVAGDGAGDDDLFARLLHGGGLRGVTGTNTRVRAAAPRARSQYPPLVFMDPGPAPKRAHPGMTAAVVDRDSGFALRARPG